MLLTSDRGGARGGLVRGITPDDLRALRPISDHIVAGSLDDFTGDDAIAVGVGPGQFYRPAHRRSADADLAAGGGDGVRHGPARAGLQGRGDLRCRAERLRQQRSCSCRCQAAQVFFQKPDAVTSIEIRVADPEQVDALLPPLRAGAARAAGLAASTGGRANDTIIGVLQVQKDTMFIVLA